MKQYSKNSEITQWMEMPCMCNCGNWHELHDGYTPREGRTLVCPLCHEIEELEDEIQMIKEEMDEVRTRVQRTWGNRKIKEIKQRIQNLRNQDE